MHHEPIRSGWDRHTGLRKSHAAGLLMLLCSAAAQAHTDAGVAGGFLTGFMHPLSGLDHLLAMVAVGIWGATLGRPLVWALPVVFPMLMVVGGVLGIANVPLPYVETGIAVSVVVLGRRLPRHGAHRLAWHWLSSLCLVCFTALPMARSCPKLLRQPPTLPVL